VQQHAGAALRAMARGSVAHPRANGRRRAVRPRAPLRGGGLTYVFAPRFRPGVAAGSRGGRLLCSPTGRRWKRGKYRSRNPSQGSRVPSACFLEAVCGLEYEFDAEPCAPVFAPAYSVPPMSLQYSTDAPRYILPRARHQLCCGAGARGIIRLARVQKVCSQRRAICASRSRGAVCSAAHLQPCLGTRRARARAAQTVTLRGGTLGCSARFKRAQMSTRACRESKER